MQDNRCNFIQSKSSLRYWEEVHGIIEKKGDTATSIDDLCKLAVYYFSIYKTLNNRLFGDKAFSIYNHIADVIQKKDISISDPVFFAIGSSLSWLGIQFGRETIFNLRNDQGSVSKLDHLLHNKAARAFSYDQKMSNDQFYQAISYYTKKLPDDFAKKHLHNIILNHYQGIVITTGNTNDIFHKLSNSFIKLGLSNGLAGELILLINAYNLGLNEDIIKTIVQNGILHILSFKQLADFSEQKFSIFPEKVSGKRSGSIFSNKLNWETGDLGHSLLFYKAHKLLKDPELKKMADLVGLNTLLRTELKTTEILSSQFLRGSAGLAFLYFLLYQQSGHEDYKKGYELWIAHTLELLDKELATDFYKENELDILQGLPGVSLVLLFLIQENQIENDPGLIFF